MINGEKWGPFWSLSSGSDSGLQWAINPPDDCPPPAWEMKSPDAGSGKCWAGAELSSLRNILEWVARFLGVSECGFVSESVSSRWYHGVKLHILHENTSCFFVTSMNPLTTWKTWIHFDGPEKASGGNFQISGAESQVGSVRGQCAAYSNDKYKTASERKDQDTFGSRYFFVSPIHPFSPSQRQVWRGSPERFDAVNLDKYTEAFRRRLA